MAIDYPPGTDEVFAFSAEPIRVYTGPATITVRFAADQPEGAAVRMALAYQPCDDRACLPAVTRAFTG